MGGGSIGPATPRHRCPGPPQNFRGDGSKPKAEKCMQAGLGSRGAGAGQGGRGGGRPRGGRQETDLGAGPREAKLAAVTERKMKALGPDSGAKKVLEEMKEQSRLPVCPHRVGHYLFCMTNRRKTIPKQHGALDTTRGTKAEPGYVVGLGPGRLALYKVAQKIHVFQFLEICVPWSAERWVWEFAIAVLQVWVGSLAGEAGSGPPPTAAPTLGYTSVEKYSVFRFSSAKEMGGCCR